MNALAALRGQVRRHAPGSLLRFVRRLRAAAEPPPIEEAVLADYRFEAEAGGGPRLNLLAPGLDPASAFGGVNTCVEFMLLLHHRLRQERPSELRLLTERPEPLEATVVPAIARSIGCSLEGISLRQAPLRAAIPTRRSDIFVCYNWWTSLNLQPVLAAQATHHAMAPVPKFHFLQEYEPLFHPFSSSQLLARLAFNLDWPLHLILNSAELEAYYRRMGDRADRIHRFEPVMNPKLRTHLGALDKVPKRRRLFVYARPLIKRNCFPLVEATLQAWSRLPEARGWDVVSAGASHRPIRLGQGLTVQPLGKLSLDGYAQLLRETALGLSLQCSPHPSYPPLELAHFGVRVLTNAYTDKNLHRRHDNIVSREDVRAGVLADALAEMCRDFDRDPGLGPRGQSHMPGFLAGNFDCLDAVADDIESLWNIAGQST